MVIAAIFFYFVSYLGASNPGDDPLTPEEWIENMGDGAWWIFKIPPRKDNNILIDNYSPAILDTFQQQFCINGGRLHWSAGSGNNDAFVPGTNRLRQESLDFVSRVIDDMTSRGMSICLMVDFQPGDYIMDREAKERYFEAWRQICEEFQDKSYLLAMSPVIEFHGWKDLPKQQRIDSLNVFYDSLTLIFREYNPKRIISYKPWGAAKRAEFNTLALPFGNDPAPSSGENIYYMVSFSGSYGLGDWWKWHPGMDKDSLQFLKNQTMNAGVYPSDKILGINAAVRYRDNTGIQFWCDHWSPNFYKNIDKDFPERWTVDQNIAYIKFFKDTLKAIGSCGAGIQLNKFWNDKENRLIGENDNYSSDFLNMSLKLIDFYKKECKKLDPVVDEIVNDGELFIYPNPFSNKIYIKVKEIDKKHVLFYDINGKPVNKEIQITYNSGDLMIINTKKLKKGIYILFIDNKKRIVIKM